MKISVLLSLYVKESPEYFDIAMKSIWDDQVRKPDEIVLVEDGPVSPELELVVEKWQNVIGEQLKVVPLKKNSGLAIALNEGVFHCTGDYIVRMDTDDIALPDRFLLQEKFADEHPDVVVFGTAMTEFNDEEGNINTRIMPLTNADIKKSICKTSPLVHPSVFIRSDIFHMGYMYNPNCRRCQDVELWFRIMADGYEMANMPDVLLKFRKDENLYHKRKKSAKSEYRIYADGIKKVYGKFSWRRIYPIAHFLYRKLPDKFALFIYEHFIVKYWCASKE